MTFYKWLMKEKEKGGSGVGDLADDVARDSNCSTLSDSFDDWDNHLQSMGACEDALKMLEWAFHTYSGREPTTYVNPIYDDEDDEDD